MIGVSLGTVVASSTTYESLYLALEAKVVLGVRSTLSLE